MGRKRTLHLSSKKGARHTATSEVSFGFKVVAGQGSIFDPSSCSVASADVPRQWFPNMRFRSLPRGLRFTVLRNIQVPGGPNKALEQTPLRVTPPACAGVAPLRVVARR